MSGGTGCCCEERRKPVKARRWIVYKRKYNTSAFNGYHRTASDYSSLWCGQCNRVWRTKAAYVDQVPDGEL